MVKFRTMAYDDKSTDPVQQWIAEDPKLSEALVEIQQSGLSVEEQAELAFHKISDMYKVPKSPEEVSDSDTETSVYEVLGLLKYLHPENDIRGLVLSAIYAVKNDLNIDDAELYKSTFAGIGYKGENSKVELVLVQKGESWVELGCRLFIKNNRLKI